MNAQQKAEQVITRNNLELLKRETSIISKDNLSAIKVIMQTVSGEGKTAIAGQLNRIEDNAEYLLALSARL